MTERPDNRDDTVRASTLAGDNLRGATDFGPRGGWAIAQRLLTDVDTTRPCAKCYTNHVRCRGAKSFVDDLFDLCGDLSHRSNNRQTLSFFFVKTPN
jgi:hypothetical protein